MDIISYILAKKKANAYTDEKISALAGGLTYKGSVATIADLPTGATKGDCYNVTDGHGIYAWDGSSWGAASVPGPQGSQGPQGPTGPAGFAPIASVSKVGDTATISITDSTHTTTTTVKDGEDGSQVSVSPTGTSTNEVQYITIDGVESKLAGGGSTVSVSGTGTSTNDVRYITIDGTESRFASVALRAMKSEWKGSISTRDAATAILADTSVVAGDGFLGTVQWTDLPSDLDQAEVKAFVIKKESGQNIVQFELTSSDYSPYAWYYNSFAREWRTYVPLNNTVTSTSTTSALTANMGKNLQDQITNLQNIGRFLSIWDATTGLPTTNPTTLPYTYRTGDYYRVGKVGGGRYIHQISLTGNSTESLGYTANFGFIEESNSAYSTFTNIAKKIYALGYRSEITGVECSYTIGGTTVSQNGFVYCPSSAGNELVFEYYSEELQSYIESGRASSANLANDTVSTAYIHDIDIEGTSTSSEVTYIDGLSFPSTSNAPYTSVADIAKVLQKLNYSATYPCFCGGQVGSTSIYLCYGAGNELVLLSNIGTEVGRIATASSIDDTTTRTGLPNYRPTGTTYNKTPSTDEESEELEVGAVYYFDSEKWVLQKSGGGGLVQDVQINGTTILDSGTGVANIPVAGTSTLGTVKVDPSTADSGIQIINGTLRTVPASNGRLEAKASSYTVVSPANLNKAVMEGLGNNSLTWSDAYKSSARNTIGAIALEEYDSTATPVDGVLYYTTED